MTIVFAFILVSSFGWLEVATASKFEFKEVHGTFSAQDRSNPEISHPDFVTVVWLFATLSFLATLPLTVLLIKYVSSIKRAKSERVTEAKPTILGDASPIKPASTIEGSKEACQIPEDSACERSKSLLLQGEILSQEDCFNDCDEANQEVIEQKKAFFTDDNSNAEHMERGPQEEQADGQPAVQVPKANNAPNARPTYRSQTTTPPCTTPRSGTLEKRPQEIASVAGMRIWHSPQVKRMIETTTKLCKKFEDRENEYRFGDEGFFHVYPAIPEVHLRENSSNIIKVAATVPGMSTFADSTSSLSELLSLRNWKNPEGCVQAMQTKNVRQSFAVTAIQVIVYIARHSGDNKLAQFFMFPPIFTLPNGKKHPKATSLAEYVDSVYHFSPGSPFGMPVPLIAYLQDRLGLSIWPMRHVIYTSSSLLSLAQMLHAACNQLDFEPPCSNFFMLDFSHSRGRGINVDLPFQFKMGIHRWSRLACIVYVPEKKRFITYTADELMVDSAQLLLHSVLNWWQCGLAPQHSQAKHALTELVVAAVYKRKN